jgi:hypothetical protein
MSEITVNRKINIHFHSDEERQVFKQIIVKERIQAQIEVLEKFKGCFCDNYTHCEPPDEQIQAEIDRLKGEL